MSLTSGLPLTSTMSIQSLSEKTGLMGHLANAMLTAETHSVTVVSLTSEENEDKYLRGCSHECRVHPRNRYVSEKLVMGKKKLSSVLRHFGETLDVAPAIK